MVNLKELEEQAAKLTDLINPFSQTDKEKGKVPFYSSGARALIRVGGTQRMVARRVRWSTSFNATPINTCDTPFPWDIDIGAVRIMAVVEEFMSPAEGLEAGALFAIMKAAVHQPMVEMQILDNLGTAVFFAKGMFTEVNGDISLGKLSSWEAKFIGIQYQHFVSQNFTPYNSIAGGVSNLVNGLKKMASDYTGGAI